MNKLIPSYPILQVKPNPEMNLGSKIVTKVAVSNVQKWPIVNTKEVIPPSSENCRTKLLGTTKERSANKKGINNISKA